MKKICFTGGGSSGHVTPNLAIIELVKDQNTEVFYIGSYDGIERSIVEKTNTPYYPISSGKLRRYFSWQNFIDPFKILLGVMQAFFILKKLKPKVVFSKGGFVTFPVAMAAKLNNIPLLVHESDFVPGLANKLAFPFAKTICLTFDATKKYIKNKAKIKITGAPLRQAVFEADREKAIKQFALDRSRATILVTGGGQGSLIINHVIYESLDKLLEKFNVIHLTGVGKLNNAIANKQNYIQVEYMHEALFDAMALADLVISRSGSNALYEIISLKKKNILIPLSKKASRGDQIDNANYFSQKGLSYVIQEEQLSSETLLKTIHEVFNHQENYEKKLSDYKCKNGVQEIVSLLTSPT